MSKEGIFVGIVGLIGLTNGIDKLNVYQINRLAKPTEQVSNLSDFMERSAGRQSTVSDLFKKSSDDDIKKESFPHSSVKFPQLSDDRYKSQSKQIAGYSPHFNGHRKNMFR